MTDKSVELSLLLAQAQRVGRFQCLAIAMQKAHGKKHPEVKKAWVVFYSATEKQERMRRKFLGMEESK